MLTDKSTTISLSLVVHTYFMFQRLFMCQLCGRYGQVFWYRRVRVVRH